MKIPLWSRPLVQLIVFCAVLFVVQMLVARRTDHEIVVTAEALAFAEQREQDIAGVPLSAEDRQVLADRVVEDEMLVREAYRLGIDRGDTRVRAGLIDAVRQILLASRDSIRDPTEGELAAYFETHLDRYRIPEAVSFEQVFFPFGTLDAEAEGTVLDTLRMGAEPGALVSGVAFARINVNREVSRRSASIVFGRDFAEQIFAAPQGMWVGPISSRQGVHYIVVRERRRSRAREYAEVERYVDEDWTFDQRQIEIQPPLAKLRRRYAVRIEGGR